MRLINTHTLQLEDFFAQPKKPEYVILSHRWGADEVNYKDYIKDRYKPTQAGYQKIVGCCELAREWECDYVWIDTCCIDKRSSAELSEAINSMYAWYQNALTCFVYLTDVTLPAEDDDWRTHFAKSAWFTRGWSKELLASRTTIFCGPDWSFLGVKFVAGVIGAKARKQVKEMDILIDTIADATGIPWDLLAKPHTLGAYSIAQRMSWAAHRETTRDEDRAYCLLGIFDINMPLLYGEGSKAFRRLQLEIIRQTNDESIFVFDRLLDPEETADVSKLMVREPNTVIILPDPQQLNEFRRRSLPLLAISPRQFAGCNNVVKERYLRRLPYQMTNQGLQLQLSSDNETWRTASDRSEKYDTIICMLSCKLGDEEPSSPLLYWLVLKRQNCGHYTVKNDGFDDYRPQRLIAHQSPRDKPLKGDHLALTLWVHTSDIIDQYGDSICG
ncbi:hypothetical protein LTR56_003110 [Elasticomyces elasticus]|nr:hypothetical protein LTR22_014330 [Elasticomyces elasticus]KAK3656407.1 hypothetical protein LTR56_003110 [Elasticomyces elasticus]KAK4927467.1 hypothetical protein LTR49_005606 [Elasticomyces elasticus]KAK5750143.1 hypothetical protein LTS12_019793 [Elasticomyces elasticus]